MNGTTERIEFQEPIQMNQGFEEMSFKINKNEKCFNSSGEVKKSSE